MFIGNHVAGSQFFHAEATLASFSGTLNRTSAKLRNLLAAATGDQSAIDGNLDTVSDSLVRAIDSMLSRVDTHLDTYHYPSIRSEKTRAGLLHANVISKPQQSFDDTIDNSTTPFIPPLPVSLEHKEQHHQQAQECGSHPLQSVIQSLDSSQQETLQPHNNTSEACLNHRGVGSAPLQMVDTHDELKQACTELKNEREIAVDLEANQYRSFHGFTCLIQLSTRSKDYIIDAQKLRSNIRPLLGPVLEDSQILKVFHGAEYDIRWIQRDFGCYVVNLFDTGQAARSLGFERLGLDALLQHFCKVKVDKSLQLADWRMRPLTDAMLSYARADTHYLLAVKDRLVALLSSPNSTGSVDEAYEQAKKVSLKLFEREGFKHSDFWAFYDRHAKIFGELSPPQLAVFAELFAWRDSKARALDESKGYVLPKSALWRLSKRMPDSVQELLSVARGEVPVVQAHGEEVAQLISKSRSQGKPPARPSKGPGSKAHRLKQLQQRQQLHLSPAKVSSTAGIGYLVSEQLNAEEDGEPGPHQLLNGHEGDTEKQAEEVVDNAEEQHQSRSEERDAIDASTFDVRKPVRMQAKPDSNVLAAATPSEGQKRKGLKRTKAFAQALEKKLSVAPVLQEPARVEEHQQSSIKRENNAGVGARTEHQQDPAARDVIQDVEEGNIAQQNANEGKRRQFIPLDKDARHAEEEHHAPQWDDGENSCSLPPPLEEQGGKMDSRKKRKRSIGEREEHFDFNAARQAEKTRSADPSAVAMQQAHSKEEQCERRRGGKKQHQSKGLENEIKAAPFKPAKDKAKAFVRSGNKSRTNPY